MSVLGRVTRNARHRLAAVLAGNRSAQDRPAGARVTEDPALFRPLVYGDPARLHIHPTAVVNNALFNLSSGEVTVGEYAFFGHSVSVLTGIHDWTKFDRERQVAVPPSGRDVVIEEGAWVSSNAIIVAPCRVGAHSVVGVGSLVMRDVEPYTVVAGSPARVLRHIPRPDEPAAADVEPEAGTAAGGAGGRMTSGDGTDGHSRRPADGDLHTDIRALAQTVTDLQHRMVALEAELRGLRADRYAGGAGSGRSRFAAAYDDFTDRFRGSTAEVTAKLEGYLPDVRRIVGTGGVVDLGCGRGEWLMLLRDAGVPASGVDASPTFVDAGRARGLDIALGDAIGHLHGLARGSVDMVTAFHVIEHLDIEELLAVLAAAWVALRPGGCLLLETPNPANLVMAACDFYNDPTHRSPLPSALTEYLVSAQGFADIEVRPLHPKPSPLVSRAEDGAVAELQAVVSRSLFGPQDYAVLGYKTHRRAGMK